MKAKAYQPTAQLISTCQTTEAINHIVSKGVLNDTHGNVPVIAGFLG